VIVFKDKKNYQTFDNENIEALSISSNVFVVNNGSELADKIKEYCPYFDFVLDSEGNLIDITPTERPPDPPEPPSEIELLRLEMAQANTELFEMMLMLNGGV